ncbi:Anti sigma-E protein RseA, N-terminal domain [gamma proteobacterium HTCC5015]|nr:Anti sigma-E protein RseA, N-terminal domain [gamma proteobacterium HTCC5015]
MKHNEWVSALADGESEQLERDIDRLLDSESAQAVWADIHQLRDQCDPKIQRKASPDFAGRVMSALESEPTILAPTGVSNRPSAKESAAVVALPQWMRPVAGLAVAASVAAVTVIGFDNWSASPATLDAGPTTPSLLNGVAVAPAANRAVRPAAYGSLAQISPVQLTGTYQPSLMQWQGERAARVESLNQAQLNQYLANHSEYSDTSNYQGILPYTRLVGYDSTQ